MDESLPPEVRPVPGGAPLLDPPEPAALGAELPFDWLFSPPGFLAGRVLAGRVLAGGDLAGGVLAGGVLAGRVWAGGVLRWVRVWRLGCCRGGAGATTGAGGTADVGVGSPFVAAFAAFLALNASSALLPGAGMRRIT